jgi:hypothetical protein
MIGHVGGLGLKPISPQPLFIIFKRSARYRQFYLLLRGSEAPFIRFLATDHRICRHKPDKDDGVVHLEEITDMLLFSVTD